MAARLTKQLLIESAGTAWLVFVGCGSVVLDAGATLPGTGALDVSLAFGLALAIAMHLSGRGAPAHFNPAITVGFTVAQRFPVRDVLPYMAAQIAGAIAGTAALVYVASGRPGFDLATNEFGVNGFGDHSPLDYPARSAFALEFLLSFVFVAVNLAVAGRRARSSFAPLVVGLCFALVNLVAMPVTNASMNPARSTGPALFVGDWALDQLWLFWAAPLAGGVLAGIVYPRLFARRRVRADRAAHADSEGA